MSKYRIRLMLLLGLQLGLWGAAPALRAQEAAEDAAAIVPGDIPIPDGFRVIGDESLIFDKPGGRILQIEAIGRGELSATRQFLLESLSQLGWVRGTEGQEIDMTRGSEQLMIVFNRQAGRLRLSYEIRPRLP